MPIINKDFPQTSESRRKNLEEVKRGNSISKFKVPGHGLLDVYKIPLSFLTYNPYNTRFLSEAKTLQARLGRELSNENPEDIEKIEEFLWSYKKENNENTINSLIKDGQLTPGVVTIDGVILAGNRRFRLLNEIDRNKDKYKKNNANIDGLGYFEAVILDTVLLKRDIIKYESFYQYGTEDKVDYDPIQKYIAAFDQKANGFSNKEIAENFMTLTKGSEKEVEKYLSVYKLMTQYLDYIGEKNIFTALTGREEAFLNLNDTLRSLRNGKTKNEGWEYEDMDISDLKCRYFDYIRLGKGTHDFRLFKKIFLNKKRWKDFNLNVTEFIKKANLKIPSMDVYRNENPILSETEISEKRRNDYIDIVKKGLNSLYGSENAYEITKKEEETPIKIAQQAYQKLEKLEATINGAIPDKNIKEIIKIVQDIQKLAGRIKQDLD